MATLGLKEMGKFLWEGREYGGERNVHWIDILMYILISTHFYHRPRWQKWLGLHSANSLVVGLNHLQNVQIRVLVWIIEQLIFKAISSPLNFPFWLPSHFHICLVRQLSLPSMPEIISTYARRKIIFCLLAKGQEISEANFLVPIFSKEQILFFSDFCPSL